MKNFIAALIAPLILPLYLMVSADAAGLPSLGLRSTVPGLSWMTNSGIPWNYRYQYLNAGWFNWASPADGTFATNYTRDSLAHGYTPVFTMYVAQSSGSAGLTFIANAGNAKGYYTQFATMLQKIEAASTTATVIVHVEPDLWGFMQQAHGDNPADVPVSVASSGYPGFSGLPDNAIGFAKALLQLRNTYAPNVEMAWHSSMWGPNNGFYPTNPSGDPVGTATRLATFYSRLGAPYDLIFQDPSDADAAYKVLVRGNSMASAWWDDNAFARYQTFLATMYSALGTPQMLWQVPIGNSLYLSENNSAHHYQDSAVQYYLGTGNVQHATNLGSAGVTAILFGKGQNNTTSSEDEAGDGITNPPAINGNSQQAQYADDDGGYLRLSAAAYYGAPPPPPSVTASLSATPSSISIRKGNSSTLAWSSSNADSCTGSHFQTGGSLSGSVSVKPTSTTVYSVTCAGSGGSASANATVTVTRK